MKIDTTKIKNKEEIKNFSVGIYLNYSLGTPPLELHRSMILDLLEKNNKVTIYRCTGGLSSCTANPSHSLSICNFCKYRSNSAIEKLPSEVTVKEINLSKFDSSNISDSQKELIKLGAMSSMASAVKAQSVDNLNRTWKKYYNNMVSGGEKLFNYFKSEIKENEYDFMFMFNGRFGDVKPVLMATQEMKIGLGLYEIKKSLHEIVFINELIHSIEGNTRRAIKAYEENPEQAQKTADEFFSKKIKNESTGDPVYTKNQERNLLPEVLLQKHDKKVVVVYPTTDDEYKFIGKEWDGHVPEDQVFEIEELAKDLSPEKYIIVVKMHPNQATTAENVIQRYLDMQSKFPHVNVEKPLSKVDSYAVLAKSDYVINFASTIGVEACYAGKVVIMIGDTTFSKMDIGYRVETGTQAATLINDNNLTPRPKLGAIMWGNYLLSYADRLPAFKRVANGDFRVNNERIGYNSFLRALQLPSKFIIEIRKPGFKVGLSSLIKLVDSFINIFKGTWSVK